MFESIKYSLVSLFLYFQENFAVFLEFFRLIAGYHPYLAAYSTVLEDISEGYGIWMAVTVAFLSQIMTLVIIQTVTSTLWSGFKSFTEQSIAKARKIKTYTKFTKTYSNKR